MAPNPAEPVIANPDGTTDVLILQGATWKLAVTYAGLADPTGWSARMMLRQRYSDTRPLESIDSGTGGVTLTQVTGGTRVDLVLTADQTAAMTTRQGVYDVELESVAGEVVRILMGRWSLSLEATWGTP